MKRAEQRQFFVVHAPSVISHSRSRRAATEEYHSGAAARRRDGLLPDFGKAGGVHGDVGAAASRQALDVGPDVTRGHGVDALADSQRFHAIEAPAPLADDDRS